MMNELVKQWIIKLRSGDYEQGHTFLRCEDKFCCLGVACDLYNNQLWRKEEDGVYKFNEVTTTFLPKEVAKTFEITRYQIQELIKLNDQGKSFSEIADVIEQWYSGR